MSLILEALKKSEEQRRLGEMPNLGTPITATRRRRSLMPWIATAVVIAIAAVGGWRFLQRGTAPAPTPAAKDTQPIRAITKPETNQAPAPTAPRSLPKPVAPPPPVQTAATPSAAAAPAPRKDTPPPLPTPAPAPATTPPAPAPAVAAAAPPPAPAPAPPANDVPSLDDLPPEVRGALPQLPISMQVYSPDPKRRFVIIDGTRVVEGESLRGVTVQEIRPNGLVIDFQGRRLLLPRPGS
jgi:general secretion pathway protein B